MNAGRLLEVGTPDELYQRPQTEFVATFLGTANLMVGQCTAEGVQLGPLRFPLQTIGNGNAEAQRVQVLFRPEDVALAGAAQEISDPVLGQGEVEQTTFVGSYERLRLRLPSIPGVRPIAPAVPYGSATIVVEATRSQDQTRLFPLKVGDRAWLGIRRLHALTHPGLRFLLVAGESPAAQAAVDIGGQIARLAHARTAVLATEPGVDQLLQQAKEQIGSGLPALETIKSSDPPPLAVAREVERQPYDLVVLGSTPNESVEVAGQYLGRGEHHLLLVPGAQQSLANVLICVASGEPGKEDVLFAGRLTRHLGASATVLTVIPKAADNSEGRGQAERFLEAGARTLELLGVPATTKVRAGVVRDEILAELQGGGYDLLVLGAPLAGDGRMVLAGVVAQIVSSITNIPVLIVRSGYVANSVFRRRVSRRVITEQEVIR
jgi:sulfate/thiosulfate transport system ATP-binding protein